MNVKVSKEETWDFPLSHPSNRYYVLVDDYKLLIDAGARPLSNHSGIDYIMITHWHWDHTYGLSSAHNTRVCLDRATLASLNPNKAKESIVEVARAVGFREDEDAVKLIEAFIGRYSIIQNAISRLEVYTLEECPPIEAGIVRYLRCPGHSRDHICYIIGDHAFVGDNILPLTGTVTLLDLASYNESMIRLMADTQWHTAHPGHGESLDKNKALEWYINHYKHKEKRLLQVLSRIPEDSWITIKRLMDIIYGVKETLTIYIVARTLIGYIATLENMGIIEVDKSQSPWRVKLKNHRS
ncbi:MAG: hypothetical protein GSR85_06545 [Desulfurococcales archaeon]|nr:hypothetical protein [Desulfurococcales archaeon]